MRLYFIFSFHVFKIINKQTIDLFRGSEVFGFSKFLVIGLLDVNASRL